MTGALTLAATLILTNGRIWTGDGFASQVRIDGNRIVDVQQTSATKHPDGARVIDLRGRLAVPGFIDNHTHFASGGFQVARVQLRDARSPDEFARRIAAQAKKLGAGKWVLGGEWDEQLWTPVALPTRTLIDAATARNPVFVTRLDLHMGLANTAALKLAGITRDTPDPAGGTIVRDADGEPTGILKDAAMDLLDRVIPPASLDERMAAVRAALREAARLGVTSVGDMNVWSDFAENLRAYQRVDSTEKLTTRIFVYLPIGEYEHLTALGITRGFGSERLKVVGLKGFSDGSLGSSTAAFFEPFDGEPENRGLLMKEMSDGSLAQWTAAGDDHDLQIALHAIGDRANSEVLQIFESRPDARTRRFRIEHAQHLNPDLIERFAESQVIAAAQPYHAIDDGRWAESKIGKERARWTYPFRSLIEAGVVVTFGSDWNVAPLDPLVGIYAAVTRRTTDGKNPDGWIPEEKLTVEQALRAYTSNNAWAMFAENEIGAIRPGLFADIVVLSEDLFKIAPEKIEDVVVDMTIMDGKVVYER